MPLFSDCGCAGFRTDSWFVDVTEPWPSSWSLVFSFNQWPGPERPVWICSVKVSSCCPNHDHELLRPGLPYTGLIHFCSRFIVAVFKDLVIFPTSWIWSSAIRGVPAPDFWPSCLNWSILLYTSQSLKFTDGPESCRLSFGWKNQCYYITVHCFQININWSIAHSKI